MLKTVIICCKNTSGLSHLIIRVVSDDSITPSESCFHGNSHGRRASTPHHPATLPLLVQALLLYQCLFHVCRYSFTLSVHLQNGLPLLFQFSVSSNILLSQSICSPSPHYGQTMSDLLHTSALELDTFILL